MLYLANRIQRQGQVLWQWLYCFS